ncbi:MAG: sugar ABC transporter permease [Candidatus Atribacteria bacterium]|nr:sugar ABC transporter permease [Candidatus Atribacteria bacterium]
MKITSVGKDFLVLPREKKSPRRLQDKLTIVLFLSPAIVLFSFFLVYPIFQSVYYSFFNWKGFGPAVDFIGLDNFKRILTDWIFLKSVGHGLLIVVLSLVIQLPLAMALALMVGRNLRGRAFFRTIFFMPYVLSEVITGIMWMILFNPDSKRGFINALLILIPGIKAIPWLGDTRTVMLALFVVLTWKYFGFYMLLYLAGLQNIPPEIEEAALIDGVNNRQMITHITIPLIGSIIRTTIYLSVLGSMQVFALVWIMTKGGPVNASEVMSTYMYRFSFVRFELGYGSAVAIVMLLISLVFSLGYLRLVRQADYLN